MMKRAKDRLRVIVRAVPGARPVRRALLGFWSTRLAALDAEPPRGALDRPVGSCLARAPVTFDGWALAGRRSVAAVDLILNDLTPIRAGLGRDRPDVRVILNESGAAVPCGWSATVDLTPWPLGDLRVKVVARSRSGKSSVIGYRLYTLQGEGFEGHLDEPREGSRLYGDLLIVRGWATIGQKPASRVDIHLNGRSVGRARLRLVRADVERHGAGRFGPVTGFEYRGVVPSEEIANIELGVTIHAIDGTTVVIPPRHTRAVTAEGSSDESRGDTFEVRAQLALRELPRGQPGAAHARPRLLVFTHSLALGGGQLYLSDLLRQLRPTLSQCAVVSPADGVLRKELEHLNIEVVISGEPPPRNAAAYEDYVRGLAGFIRASECDVVLLNTLGPWSAGDAALRAHIPFLWSIHESFELSDWIALNFGDDGLPTYMRRRLETTLGAASRLIFESQATSGMFARYADEAHRSIVPYGIDAEGIAQFAAEFDRTGARTERGLPDDATVLLSMGVFEERKSQACIVEAFSEVAAVHPKARLILVGDHPCEYSNAIHRMISNISCADRILILPIMSKIWEWYALSDVLVSASDIESLPRSMLECMAFSVPVLSTDVFGVPELVEDGVNGWLFNPRDMGALIATMHRVLSLEPVERQIAGAAARVTVQQRHRWANYAHAYRDLLSSALAVR